MKFLRFLSLSLLVAGACTPRVDKKRQERFNNSKIAQMIEGFWLPDGKQLYDDNVELTLFDKDGLYHVYQIVNTDQNMSEEAGEYDVQKSGKVLALKITKSTCAQLDPEILRQVGKPDYVYQPRQDDRFAMDVSPKSGVLELSIPVKDIDGEVIDKTTKLKKVKVEMEDEAIRRLNDLRPGCYVAPNQFVDNKLGKIARKTPVVSEDPSEEPGEDPTAEPPAEPAAPPAAEPAPETPTASTPAEIDPTDLIN